jgi:hypothetical protein
VKRRYASPAKRDRCRSGGRPVVLVGMVDPADELTECEVVIGP